MHPLAHALTGALVGQAAPGPVTALLGGVASHFVLDAIPHTEGETFRGAPAAGLGMEHVEAGVELVLALTGLWWLATSCPLARPQPLALGVFGALLPDLIDLPLRALTGRAVLHVRRWHRTARRRQAVLGILTQVLTVIVSAGGLWLLAGCGR